MFCFSIGGDDFDVARQALKVIKAPPLSVAILKGHALNSFSLDQYGSGLLGLRCFRLRNLALVVHTISVTLKAKAGSPYFVIIESDLGEIFVYESLRDGDGTAMKAVQTAEVWCLKGAAGLNRRCYREPATSALEGFGGLLGASTGAILVGS